MTVPLIRVCFHCGYPTPGRHSTGCPDFNSGVVTVAAPYAPVEGAEKLRQILDLERRIAQLENGLRANDTELDRMADWAGANVRKVKAMRPVMELIIKWYECVMTEVDNANDEDHRGREQDRLEELLIAAVADYIRVPEADRLGP